VDIKRCRWENDLMDVAPGPSTVAGLIAGAAILPTLMLFSHRPLRISSTTRRFPAAALLCLTAWAVATAAAGLSGEPLAWYDMLAGALLLLAILWAAGVFWTLMCWGVTTSLLQALTRCGRPVDPDTWFREYAGGGDIEMFTRDRLSVLTASGLASWRGREISLNVPRALWLTLAVGILWRLYGVQEDG
jgi:hypothetical protein